MDPNDFFGSGSYFSVGFGSYMVFKFFYNILNMKFTFVFTYRKCVRLHFMTRYELFREICFSKEFFFKLSVFDEKLLKVSDLTGFGSGSTTLLQRACFGFQIAAYGFNEELFTKPPVIPKVVLKSTRIC